jgi:predicted kinase
LALGELETPGQRPCLVLVGGLPGTGKSTLAQGLAERADFRLIRSDLVRKELAGLPARESARSPFEEGIYAPAWSERTYAECLCRAEKLLRTFLSGSFSASVRAGTASLAFGP